MVSKAVLFGRTDFLIEDLWVFSKDRWWWPKFKACWVNLVKGRMGQPRTPTSSPLPAVLLLFQV